MNIGLFKIIVNFLKYYVVIGSTIMTIYCAFLISGVDFWIVDILVRLSLGGYLSLLISSYLLRMCTLYRLFLSHLFLVSLCMSIQENIGFGILLQPLRIIVFLIGLSLIIKLIYDRGFNCAISTRCCR